MSRCSVLSRSCSIRVIYSFLCYELLLCYYLINVIHCVMCKKCRVVCLVQCIVSLFYDYILSSGLTWYISYSYSMIFSICAESAIKHPLTNYVTHDINGGWRLVCRFCADDRQTETSPRQRRRRRQRLPRQQRRARRGSRSTLVLSSAGFSSLLASEWLRWGCGSCTGSGRRSNDTSSLILDVVNTDYCQCFSTACLKMLPLAFL